MEGPRQAHLRVHFDEHILPSVHVQGLQQVPEGKTTALLPFRRQASDQHEHMQLSRRLAIELKSLLTFNLPAFTRGLSRMVSSACSSPHSSGPGAVLVHMPSSCSMRHSCLPDGRCLACTVQGPCHAFAESQHGRHSSVADIPASYMCETLTS